MNATLIHLKFRRIALFTLGALYVLILVGGIVRASGSGMGCPDWPTCFGRLIPPTQESQLPPNYHELYIGYGNTTFNPLKTWTEYLNRLLGATIGILVFLTLVRSWPFRKMDPPVFWGSLGIFLLVGFQGWLGSRVVASDLRPVMITAHMVTAFIIVVLLIEVITRSQKAKLKALKFNLPAKWHLWLKIALGLTLLQVTMGTQIREAVDGFSQTLDTSSRSLWRDHFPIIFYIHRSFSSLILFTNLWLSYRLIRSKTTGTLYKRFGWTLASLVVIAILSGVSLDRLGFPAVVQPLHLLLANLIFGCQFFLWASSRTAQKSAS